MGYPSSRGLYDPANEHDACGVGMVAHIKGEKATRSLRRLWTFSTGLITAARWVPIRCWAMAQAS